MKMPAAVHRSQERARFGRDEILACARGGAMLPGSLLLPFHEITDIHWDEESQTGRIEAVRYNEPDDWFYACHFLGDPVMPGCWSVDAVWQCLRFFAAWRGISGCEKTLGMEDVRFFGQIRPYDKKVSYLVDIVSIERSGDEALVTGKAAVEVDGMTVYQLGVAQIGTAFWESPPKGASDIAPPPLNRPLEKKLGYEEFASRAFLSHTEIVALSQGTLVKDPPVELGLLPASLMLEVGQVHRIAYDDALGEGTIEASKRNNPEEWFYSMNGGVKPTALSIDAIWQLLGLFLAWRRNAGTGRALGFERVEVFDAITPAQRDIVYKVQILKETRTEGGGFARANAQVFADGRRVLNCFNASVSSSKDIRYSDYPVLSEMAFGGKLKSSAKGVKS